MVRCIVRYDHFPKEDIEGRCNVAAIVEKSRKSLFDFLDWSPTLIVNCYRGISVILSYPIDVKIKTCFMTYSNNQYLI